MSELVDLQLKWYYRLPWTRVLMFVYCIACSCVGLIGLVDRPSPAFENVLGVALVHLYSAMLVVSGVTGAVGIFRSLRATVISVWTIAAGTLFHGLTVVAYPGGLQTGLRLAVAPLMMIPLVWTWWQWLIIVLHVKDGAWWEAWREKLRRDRDNG